MAAADALLGLPRRPRIRSASALVIILTTYVSLVIGELVPKQIALRSPEPIAGSWSRADALAVRIMAPFVWLLDRSSGLVFRLLRLDRESEDQVTAEELHLVVAEAQTAGVLEESERAMISGVVRLADRPMREVMTPRTEVDWIDVDADRRRSATRWSKPRTTAFRSPKDRSTSMVGVVQARDVRRGLIDGRPLDLRALMPQAPVVPDQIDAMDAMTVLRGAEVPMAFVHDEYGHLDGIVTPGNLLAALAGTFAHDVEQGDRSAAGRARRRQLVGLGLAPAPTRWPTGSASTCPRTAIMRPSAGFALSVLKHIPEVGETLQPSRLAFEIVDMDGRKIDKLIASRAEGRGGRKPRRGR